MEALRHGELSVTDLVGRVGPHQPAVSRHLRVMLDAGCVTSRKDAQRRLYSIAPDPLKELDAWLSRFRGLWDARFSKLMDHLATTKRSKKP